MVTEAKLTILEQKKLAENEVPHKPNPANILQTCPRCGFVGKGGAMKRWHFDNCTYEKIDDKDYD